LLVGRRRSSSLRSGRPARSRFDPIAFGVSPPSQTTTPGTQVEITFTVSDVPPCVAGNLTSLDSLDFAVSDPSGLSTIASFTVSEPAGTYDGVFSSDMKALTLLFDSAFPCMNGTTETITVVVTVDVPRGVPSGTQLTLHGNGGGPPVGGEPGSTPAGASGGVRTPAAATATPVRATPRFAG
jgi:hypothetical protein